MQRLSLAIVAQITVIFGSMALLLPGVAAPPMEVFFVSSGGSDQWSGRLSAPNPAGTDGPFATPIRARDAAREVLKEAERRSVTVRVLEGKYFLSETLLLDERDSGTAESPVTWTAHAGARPVLSGGACLRDWKPFQGKILQADLAQIGVDVRPKDFYLNGDRQVRARTPNRDPANPLYGGWAFMEGAVGDDGFSFPTGLLAAALKNPTQAFVRFFAGPNGGWGSDLTTVASMDLDAHTIRTSYQHGANPLLGFNANTRFILENAVEFLDQPGEWCVDWEAGRIYFWPPEEFTEELETVVPALSTLVRFANASWITFEGFTLTETPPGGNDALRCEDSDNIRITENRFFETGSRALGIFGTARPCINVIVRRNEFSGTGGSAIYVGGSVRDGQIVQNRIHHCAVYDKYNAGIEFPFYGATAHEVSASSYTDGFLIAENYLHDLPRDGIQLGANPYGRHRVERNRVERVALETLDGGAIRSHRVVSHLQGVEGLAEMKGHIIRENYIADTMGCGVTGGRIVTPYPWPTFGIYLDEGTSNCDVYGNHVIRSGVGIITNPGAGNTIENNVLVGNGVALFYQAPAPFDTVSPPLGSNRFRHNIVYMTSADALAFNFSQPPKLVLTESDHNVFWNTAGTVLFESSDIGGKTRVRRTLAEWQHRGLDSSSLLEDPMFSNPQAGYFGLLRGSPALRLGFTPIRAFRP